QPKQVFPHQLDRNLTLPKVEDTCSGHPNGPIGRGNAHERAAMRRGPVDVDADLVALSDPLVDGDVLIGKSGTKVRAVELLESFGTTHRLRKPGIVRDKVGS